MTTLTPNHRSKVRRLTRRVLDLIETRYLEGSMSVLEPVHFLEAGAEPDVEAGVYEALERGGFTVRNSNGNTVVEWRDRPAIPADPDEDDDVL